jgi:hypothetical protein
MSPRVRSPFADVFKRLARAFRSARVGYYIFGAQAALLYGSARLTADVDVTVRLGERSVSTLVAALERAGFHLRFAGSDFVKQTRVLPLVDAKTRIPVDVVLAGPGLEDLFLERAQTREIEGVPLRVARAEDVIAMKILSGRPKDLEDVAALLVAQRGTLDLDMTRSTLRLLEEALEQSDLLPLLDAALDGSRRKARKQARAARKHAPARPKRK